MNLSNIINNKKTDEIPQNIITLQLTKSKNKYITSIEGILYLATDSNFLNKFSRYLKKKLCCGAHIKDNNIELQGDHIENVKKILNNEYNVDSNNIVIKGK